MKAVAFWTGLPVMVAGALLFMGSAEYMRSELKVQDPSWKPPSQLWAGRLWTAVSTTRRWAKLHRELPRALVLGCGMMLLGLALLVSTAL